jgi:hypothetical protein
MLSLFFLSKRFLMFIIFTDAFGCGVGSSLDTNEQKQIRQK